MVRYFYTSTVIYGVVSDLLAEILDLDCAELHAQVYLGSPVKAVPINSIDPEKAVSLEDAITMPDGTYRLCMNYSPGFLLTDLVTKVESTITRSVRPSMRPRMSTFPDAPSSRRPTE